ncbi:MAG: bifunctional diaminohydroxyphosphoribosylaminopyrimidine deaminase/5-amino-6-(5-phosphoribosylamino)uracil reductase RibD, partial [Aestuariivirgaceae bacterium]
MNTDQRWMAYALALGRRNAGATAENPAVGCVITRRMGLKTVPVGIGWTALGGRPHAETEAIAMAGAAAHGATAYVTLEPCNHRGRTAPCTRALIDAGLARVVISLRDPDLRVAGQGIRALREAGIAVDTGILETEARQG